MCCFFLLYPLPPRQPNRFKKKAPLPRICNHNKQAVFKCHELSKKEIQSFNDNYFRLQDRPSRDAFILMNLQITHKKRETCKKTKATETQDSSSSNKKKRNRSSGETNFFIPAGLDAHASRFRVCKQFFLRSLGGLGRTVVENIAQNFLRNGSPRKEKRGGDKKSNNYAARRKLVKDFIRSLPGRESHHNRTKSKRIYLCSDIHGIKHLWNIFLKKERITDKTFINYRFFYNIFKKAFNIGFGSIKTDACSTCSMYTNKIRSATEKGEKSKLMMEKHVHKKRANVFYELVSEKRPGLATFCFDHQQNLVIPRVQDQQAYYSRQMYTYNFGVVRGREDNKLTRENCFVYTWNENDHKKDSSACCSALLHALTSSDLTGIDTVRLCSDACGGQNKNMSLIYMACHFLSSVRAARQVKNIELVFPVRGHSFLPCDRLFGLIEKEVRKCEVILSPQGYYDIFQKFAQVIKVRDDVEVRDLKKAAEDSFKRPLPIKIQENKRFYISRGRNRKHCLVAGEMSYRNRINEPVVVTKKTESCNSRGDIIPGGIPLNPLKIKDMDKLMEGHCGEDWKTNCKDEKFNFLRNILSSTTLSDSAAPHDCRHGYDYETCEDCCCLEVEPSTLTV